MKYLKRVKACLIQNHKALGPRHRADARNFFTSPLLIIKELFSMILSLLGFILRPFSYLITSLILPIYRGKDIDDKLIK